MFTLKMAMELIDKVTKPVSKIGKAVNTLSRNTGLDKVARGFSDLRGPMNEAGREAFRFGKWVVGGATAASGALFALTNATANHADQLVKTADRLGVNVEELQRLRWAAELGGVSTQTFDVALQRFTRRTAEAAAGTGVAKDALNALGIELKDKATGNLRPVEELMGEVADKMAQIEDPAKRVRLAFTLFDTEGVKLINMLQGGKQALIDAGKEAEQFGLITEEDARRAEVFNDNMSRVQTILKHVGYAIGNSLMPFFNDFVLVLKDVALEARPQIIAGLKDAIELLGTAARFTSEKWQALKDQIGLLNASLLLSGGFVASWLEKIISLAEILGQGRVAIALIASALGLKLAWALAGLFKPMAMLIWYLGVAAAKITLLAGKATLAAARLLIGFAPALLAGSKAALRFAVSGVAAAIKGLIALAPSILGATVAAWGFAAALLANPITWVVGGIAALVAAGLWLWSNWDQVSEWLSGAWETIKTAFSSMMDGFIEGLVNFHPLALIMKAINSMIEYLFGIDLSQVGEKWLNSISDGIKQNLNEVGNLLGDLATSAVSFLGGDSSTGSAAPALAAAVPSALQSRGTEVSGSVLVDFANMPQNARVQSTSSSGIGVDTSVAYAGRSMSGF